ncbi:hypothetical protein BACCAP_04890 [Pseudoflavonifractor capillosus ATCC 29799]|uniref:Uncharacterized protein n=1 Tax=Pseudoflavonifractor capillosus ATCC 29799 TaxID=411467 RepID=A6P306_9FIRM|nr:hypothetical protein BACCAP_04890 [Pseudoflavonifractor capillosus ATCC 29799]
MNLSISSEEFTVNLQLLRNTADGKTGFFQFARCRKKKNPAAVKLRDF